MWRSLVAHFVRDEGAAGSNPVIPIFIFNDVLGVDYPMICHPFYACSATTLLGKITWQRSKEQVKDNGSS
jgi:hypothetical protein